MSYKPYNWSNSRKPPLLQPHSIAKHEVIEAYLERYIEVLTADPRQDGLRLTIVDGFSGGGMSAMPKPASYAPVRPSFSWIRFAVWKRLSNMASRRAKPITIMVTYFPEAAASH